MKIFTIVCPHCGTNSETTDYRKKFCNQSCSASFYNLKRGPKLNKKQCLFCNREFQNRPSIKQVYCTKECRWDHQLEQWKLGLVEAGYKYGLRAPFRNLLLRRANYACEQCGWNEINVVTGKVPLTVDHIDGDWKNNSYDNLRVLCPNCHSLTPTYGALNIGNAKVSRNSVRGRTRQYD